MERRLRSRSSAWRVSPEAITASFARLCQRLRTKKRNKYLSLRKQTISGVKWIAASTIVNAIFNFVRIAALAHLLTITDFGLMSMAMVVIYFSDAFVDFGISSAVIYRQESSPEKLSSLYWMNLMLGAAVFGAVFLLAPLIAGFYNEPRIVTLMP